MSAPKPEEVIEANIQVHTRMAHSYNRNEPHYRAENRAKVRAKLKEMRRFGSARLLDLGCGTGFIIDLAKDLFDAVDGIDVTQAMLDKVDLSSGNVSLHRCAAEALPFADASFDVVSAYAFIHHLKDYSKVLREACRVLKPGGGCYIDLEPNRLFWQAMVRLEREAGGPAQYSDIVQREIEAVLHRDEGVMAEFGIEREVFNAAEYTKALLGGIDPWQFRAECLRLGFGSCEVNFQWFLGQGAVMHQQSFEAAATVESYLRRILPLTAECFKYLQFVLTK